MEELIRESGYEVVRRTRMPAKGPEEGVVGERSAVARVGLLDTIGELASLFSAADVVLMGGSLANIGGHDILQPLAQGKPVVFGPHMHKSRDITELALREGVAFQVGDSEGAFQKIDELLKDDEETARLAVAGPAAVEKYRGASERCAAELAELVENGSFEGEQ